MASPVLQDNSIKEIRLFDTDELRIYTGLGRNNAMKLGEMSGARIEYGKRVLWDKIKIDRFIDGMSK